MPPVFSSLRQQFPTVQVIALTSFKEEKLVVSPSTVKSHVSHILAKLDVPSRTEAVALAVQHGTLD